MNDCANDEAARHPPSEHSRRPWGMYVIVGLFAVGIAAALLGVRTCL